MATPEDPDGAQPPRLVCAPIPPPRPATRAAQPRWMGKAPKEPRVPLWELVPSALVGVWGGAPVWVGGPQLDP